MGITLPAELHRHHVAKARSKSLHSRIRQILQGLFKVVPVHLACIEVEKHCVWLLKLHQNIA